MQKNNKRILFICPYPLNEAPSQRFRFEQYFDILNENGFVVETSSFIDLATWKILYLSGHFLNKTWGIAKGFIKRMFLLFYVPTFDFIFIHREATPVGPPWFEWMVVFLLRKKVIYDFDDSIWMPNTSDENRIARAIKFHSKVKSICRWSHAVSCGNDYLCTFAKQFNKNVFLIPTTIDTISLHNQELYPSRTTTKSITIGWTGTHSTLKYLDSFLPVIQKLEYKFPNQLTFLVISNTPPDFNLSSLHFRKWTKETEIQDLLQFDIGIMPLSDDPWSKGKCGFKLLQYMALGIPAVVSPVGVNLNIVQPGVNSFLCNEESMWIETIEKLINDSKLRKTIGSDARKFIVDNYSVTSNAPNFLSIFD